MSDEEPRFDFSEGAGETLGSLPCFTLVGNRRDAVLALETALEPVHRIAYGRVGIVHTRRSALENFKGFPPSLKAEVSEKIGRLTKDSLRLIIDALGVDVKVSQPVVHLATAVTDFLMAPRDTGKIKDPKEIKAAKREEAEKKKEKKAAAAKLAAERKAKAAKKATEAKLAAAKKAKAAKRPADEAEAAAKQVSKAAKKETTTTTTAQSAVQATEDGPSDDAVCLEVCRRVLAMPYEERAVLGVKALRTSLEEHFKLPAGGLKARKDIITATASDCVRALHEAEDRAAAVATAAAAATEAKEGDNEVTPASAGDGEDTAAVAVPSAEVPADAAPQERDVPPMHPGVLPQ